LSQKPSVIPQPQQMTMQDGSFILDNEVVIDIIPSTDKALADIAYQFIQQLGLANGPILKLYRGKMTPGVRYIRFAIYENKSANPES